ncbi:hypothetical protein XU18_0620 [Perkinsela sp. CCAP 1560/4]|nr:hypothetical protein XU18_3660 [Perkinsela sp. CCAP 1560/4]KNH09110.1 hypothetical protein XU18_0620 [Perkinsela sp. CCAP 1560/4]|eukprot:KNH05341.1 hypothetical protein XU18_3660 [Perkinsela sp. CCAP 1560/4]
MPRYETKLAGGLANFGGQLTPFCNYTSQYAKGFAYREMDKYTYPLSPTLFRLKLRTAAELRFADIVNKYMQEKINTERVKYFIMYFRTMMYDNMNNIIPKDEYEIQKMTSYMMSRQASDEFRRQMIKIWVRILFTCEAQTYAGHFERAWEQRAQLATEEEFMSYIWFLICSSTFVSAVVTAIYWYWKYGQGYEVAPIY